MFDVWNLLAIIITVPHCPYGPSTIVVGRGPKPTSLSRNAQWKAQRAGLQVGTRPTGMVSGQAAGSAAAEPYRVPRTTQYASSGKKLREEVFSVIQTRNSFHTQPRPRSTSAYRHASSLAYSHLRTRLNYILLVALETRPRPLKTLQDPYTLGGLCRFSPRKTRRGLQSIGQEWNVG